MRLTIPAAITMRRVVGLAHSLVILDGGLRGRETKHSSTSNNSSGTFGIEIGDNTLAHANFL